MTNPFLDRWQAAQVAQPTDEHIEEQVEETPDLEPVDVEPEVEVEPEPEPEPEVEPEPARAAVIVHYDGPSKGGRAKFVGSEGDVTVLVYRDTEDTADILVTLTGH